MLYFGNSKQFNIEFNSSILQCLEVSFVHPSKNPNFVIAIEFDSIHNISLQWNRQTLNYHLKLIWCSKFLLRHGDIILNRSNNRKITIEISVPQKAGTFIIKCKSGIQNKAKCK